MQTTSPMKLPTIAQNGSTMPLITSPRSNAMMTGVAGESLR